jgi:DUF3011 family protein
MKFGLFPLLLVLMGWLASAQGPESVRRATLTGRGGDSGKCTIEVDVSEIAEIEVSGDTGRLRTISGPPARWRRFECSGPLPRNPADFRFKGVDGRGRVALVRDPRETRGVAVVRIEDRQGGREGYTFDLEWRGGTDRYGPDSYNQDRDGRYDGDRDGRYYRDRDDRSHADGETVTITCSSDDMRRHYCDVDAGRGVRLLRQRSDAECREGYSWGYDRRGIWVDRGCRADFMVRR